MSESRAAHIEIVDPRKRPIGDNLAESILVPRELRINGTSVSLPSGYPIQIHEMNSDNQPEPVMVTLTLYASRIEIKAEASDE